MEQPLELLFEQYEAKLKALADQRRLQILHMLCHNGTMCVCDLVDAMGIPQSKLSYHLKILLDAGFIIKETKGTWSYYSLHKKQIDQVLSEKVCCLFSPSH